MPATAVATPAMTEEQAEQLRQAYDVVRKLGSMSWPGERPADLPVVRPLRTWRLRLKSVTTNVTSLGTNPLRDYLRGLREIVHPLVALKPEMAKFNEPTPHGADCVDAHDQLEAWEKFRKRFSIVRTSEPYTILEVDSDDDKKAEEQEEAEIKQEITAALARRGLVPTTPNSGLRFAQ
jgi:hypothetical protein